LADYVSFTRTQVPETDRDHVLVRLRELFDLWQKEQQAASQPVGVLAWLTGHLGTIGLIAFGAVVAGGIIVGLAKSSFLDELADDATVRGLITFLVAVCTISIALLTAIAIFFIPAAEIESRFSKAKDLLAILVGILGTILGFYFGSINQTGTPDGGTRIEATGVPTTPPPAAPGTTSTSPSPDGGDAIGAGAPSSQ